MTMPKAPIPAPTRTPPRIGLLASARSNLGGSPALPTNDPVTGQRIRWEGGIAFRPERCGDWDVLDRCDATTAPTPQARGAVEELRPFILATAALCGTQERAEDVQAEARQLIERVTPKGIEGELWNGARTVASNLGNQYLTDPTATDIANGVTAGLVQGLAELQQYLADTGDGGRGMIHASRRLVTAWESASLVRREPGSNVVTDLYDNLIVAGAGYPGTGPRQDAVWTITNTGGATAGTYDLDIVVGGDTISVDGILYNQDPGDLQVLIRAADDRLSAVTVTGNNLDTAGTTVITFTGGTATTDGGPVGGQAVTVTLDDTNITGTGATAASTTTGGPQTDATLETQWAYATDLVDVRLSDITLTPDTPQGVGTVTTEDNEIQYQATRWAIAYWDLCRHGYVRVEMCGCANDLTGA